MSKDQKTVEEIRGYGFQGKNGRLFLTRCFKCYTENYAMAVASGICSWCGYKMTKLDLAKVELEND